MNKGGDILMGCVLLGMVYLIHPYIERYRAANDFHMCWDLYAMRDIETITLEPPQGFYASVYKQYSWTIGYHFKHKRCPVLPLWATAMDTLLEYLAVVSAIYDRIEDQCRDHTGYQGKSPVRRVPVLYRPVKGQG